MEILVSERMRRVVRFKWLGYKKSEQVVPNQHGHCSGIHGVNSIPVMGIHDIAWRQELVVGSKEELVAHRTVYLIR